MALPKPNNLMTSQPSESSIQGRAVESSSQPSPNSNCSFLVDLADIQTMKQNLQDLLCSFRAGKQKAFGDKNTIEQMENIRSMQGKLARLHFGLDRNVDYEGLEDSHEGLELHDNNMTTLLKNLEDVSSAIKSLNKQPKSVDSDGGDASKGN